MDIIEDVRTYSGKDRSFLSSLGAGIVDFIGTSSDFDESKEEEKI